MLTIESIARWLRKTQGRDKLCKVLQYVCRLLAACYQPHSQYKTLIYSTLFEALRETRKLFRFLKSVDEFQYIKQLVFFGKEQLDTVLQIAYRICYFIYWIMDNITAAARVKLLKANYHTLHVISLRVRCIAICISIFNFFYHLKTKEMDQAQRNMVLLKGARDLSDMLPTLKDSLLIPQLSESFASIGGLISSLISSYMVFTSDSIK